MDLEVHCDFPCILELSGPKTTDTKKRDNVKEKQISLKMRHRKEKGTNKRENAKNKAECSHKPFAMRPEHRAPLELPWNEEQRSDQCSSQQRTTKREKEEEPQHEREI